jgi:hypothetical protein
MRAFMPVKPTFAQLATEAIDGSADAAFQLAKCAPDKGFLSWLAKWVPAGEMTAEVFDRFADAYHRMEMDRELERLEKEQAA